MGICENSCGELPSSAKLRDDTRFCEEPFNGTNDKIQCDKAMVRSEVILPVNNGDGSPS